MSEALSDDDIRILRALAAGVRNAMVCQSRGSAAASNGSGQQRELDDSFLDAQTWTDRVVKKDPKRWNGESMVGRRYSECSAEWHDEMASFCDWKAGKERQENPPKLNDKGKPWHEVTAFEAAISRAWARRIRERGPAATTEESGSTDEAIDGCPF